MMKTLPSTCILKVYFISLICSSKLSPILEGEESKVSNEQAVSVIESTLQTLSEQLTNCQRNVAALSIPNISFISNELSFSVQNESRFENHLEDCFTSNGFLISDPQLLINVPSELPHQLILSTFDTSLLLSKPVPKVAREIQKNKAKCSIWTQETKEMSSSANCAEELLKSLCIKHVGVMTRDAIHQHQVVQSIFPSLILSLQNRVKDMPKYIVVQPEFINQVGNHITAAGTTVLALLSSNATTVSPLQYSLLFHMSVIKDHLQQASYLLTQSSLKIRTKTDNSVKAIVSDINALKNGFQTIAERQNQQQLNAIDIADFERQLKGFQLKQQELEHTLDQAKLKQIKTLLQKEDSTSDSGLAPNDDLDKNDGNNGTDIPEVPFSNHSTLASLDKRLKELWHRTIQLWPTNLTMQEDDFYKYSIMNFYAAVLWAVLMVIIFTYTCLLAIKRNQRITLLENKMSRISPRRPKPTQRPSQPETKPLILQEDIKSVINKHSKS